MKTINIYFQAVTKVSLAHIIVNDEENIEEYIKQWAAQGYCRCHYMSNKIAVYIPWNNVVYCQYMDDTNQHGDIANAGED